MKVLEIRDRATFIPVLAVLIDVKAADDASRYLLRRAGFGEYPFVLLTKLNAVESQYNPYEWGGRTMPAAHDYIEKHWSELVSGDVVDVEYILGETSRPKRSEREDENEDL